VNYSRRENSPVFSCKAYCCNSVNVNIDNTWVWSAVRATVNSN